MNYRTENIDPATRRPPGMAHMQAIIDLTNECIVITDETGAIEEFNPAAERVFGYTRDEMRGCDISMLLYPPLYTASDRLVRLQVTGACKDGRTVPLELKLKRVVEAETRQFVYLLRDVSARKEAELARTDPLTGIPNRRYFDEMLTKECRRMARESKALSLLMCDIDYFKHYNDTYGHLEGDRCLREIAELLQAACRRPADFAARYGGEEFVVVLPDCDAVHALEIAARIKRELDLRKITHAASTVAEHVTLSMGVATVRPADSGEVPLRSLARADEALYRAKRNGRNQVVRAKSGPAFSLRHCG